MKKKYNKNVKLRCETCGGESFEYNEDKSYIKCNLCNREYHDGFDELVEFNKENINYNIAALKKEFNDDLHKRFATLFKK